MSLIVLIEDDPHSARLATRLLEKGGHQVVAVLEGEEGLSAVANHHPDVILVDLGLPDMDGETIIALLKQRTASKDIPIVAFTAWPEEAARSMGAAYGCDGVITKPIDTRTFVEQVAKFLKTQ